MRQALLNPLICFGKYKNQKYLLESEIDAEGSIKL